MEILMIILRVIEALIGAACIASVINYFCWLDYRKEKIIEILGKSMPLSLGELQEAIQKGGHKVGKFTLGVIVSYDIIAGDMLDTVENPDYKELLYKLASKCSG